MKNLAFSGVTILVANVLVMVVGLTRSLIIAHYLEPADFGFFALAMNLLSYASYFDIGLASGILYLVPRLVGANQTERALAAEENGVFSSLTASVMVFGLASIIGTLVWTKDWSLAGFKQTYIAIFLFGLSAIVLINTNSMIVVARIRERFPLLSLTNFCSALFTLILSYMLLVLGGDSISLLVAWLCGTALSSLFLYMKLKPQIRKPSSVTALKDLIAAGFLPSLLPLCTMLWNNIDRWILATLVSQEDLGLYSLGLTFSTALALVPQSISLITTKRLGVSIGAAGSNNGILNILTQMLLLLSWIQAFAVAMVYLCIPILIEASFSRYIGAIPIIQLLILSVLPLYSLAVVYESFAAMQESSTLITIVAFLIGLKFAILYWASSGFGISGAAKAALFCNLVFSIVIMVTCLRLAHCNLKFITQICLKCLVPLVVFGGGAYLLQHEVLAVLKNSKLIEIGLIAIFGALGGGVIFQQLSGFFKPRP